MKKVGIALIVAGALSIAGGGAGITYELMNQDSQPTQNQMQMNDQMQQMHNQMQQQDQMQQMHNQMQQQGGMRSQGS